MNEKQAPTCPYCGLSMQIDPGHLKYNKQYRYKCIPDNVIAPSRPTEEEAYAAAMRRAPEPNRVLTREEFIERTKHFPIWCASRYPAQYKSQWIPPQKPSAIERSILGYGRDWVAWLYEPTAVETRAFVWGDVQ